MCGSGMLTAVFFQGACRGVEVVLKCWPGSCKSRQCYLGRNLLRKSLAEDIHEISIT